MRRRHHPAGMERRRRRSGGVAHADLHRDRHPGRHRQADLHQHRHPDRRLAGRHPVRGRPTQATSNGRLYTKTASQTITVLGANLVKSASPTAATIGQTVTYTVVGTLNAERVVLQPERHRHPAGRPRPDVDPAGFGVLFEPGRHHLRPACPHPAHSRRQRGGDRDRPVVRQRGRRDPGPDHHRGLQRPGGRRGRGQSRGDPHQLRPHRLGQHGQDTTDFCERHLRPEVEHRQRTRHRDRTVHDDHQVGGRHDRRAGTDVRLHVAPPSTPARRRPARPTT